MPEFDKNIDVNYQYKLNGIYNEWSSLSETPYVNLNNLPFGDYTFEVRSVGAFKYGVHNSTQLEFKVLPSFTQT